MPGFTPKLSKPTAKGNSRYTPPLKHKRPKGIRCRGCRVRHLRWKLLDLNWMACGLCGKRQINPAPVLDEDSNPWPEGRPIGEES